MSNSRRGSIPSELGWLIDELDRLSSRLDTLEAPSGETLDNTVPKLEALIADIQAQLDAWAASRWTNAEIQTEIANQINAKLAGNIAIGGTLTVAGRVYLTSTPGRVFTVEPRAVVWMDTSNGEIGRT